MTLGATQQNSEKIKIPDKSVLAESSLTENVKKKSQRQIANTNS